LACTAGLRDADIQVDFTRLHAAWAVLEADALPDGDAELDHEPCWSWVLP
jgi:hypothetical protein